MIKPSSEDVLRDVQRTFNLRNEVVQEVSMSRLFLGRDWVEVNDGAKGLIGGGPVDLVFKPTPVLVVEFPVRPDQAIGVSFTIRWAPSEGLLQVADLCPIGVVCVEVPAPI